MELVGLVWLIGVAGFLYFRTHGDEPIPQTVPPVTASAPAPDGQIKPEDIKIIPGHAASFALPRVQGSPLTFNGKGPLLITLSAVGCQGCQQRVGIDRQAYEAAHRSKVPVWNIFVYSQAQGAQSFKDQLKPFADEFLYDADGHVSVNTYGGSDSSCWILIDKEGMIAYRGGSDLGALQKKLATLPHEGT